MSCVCLCLASHVELGFRVFSPHLHDVNKVRIVAVVDNCLSRGLHPWSSQSHRCRRRRQFPAVVELSADSHSPGERELILKVCCEDCVVWNGLARLVFVVDGAFPDVRGELSLGHLLGHSRLLQNCPEFVVHSVVPEVLAVLVQLLQCGRIFVSCQLSDFSLVAEKIACCVQVVSPFVFAFRCFGSFLRLRLSTHVLHLDFFGSDCYPLFQLLVRSFAFLSACCWHCSFLPAVGTALFGLLLALLL